MSDTYISIARDFSRFPAGRYSTDGPYSGQRFREELLVPALKRSAVVTIDVDGTLGYGSSFLEEAFGGLLREERFTLQDMKRRLRVVSQRRSTYVAEIWSYIEDEAAKAR